MTSFYFIDAENVHGNGLKGSEILGEDDQVTIFYSKPISIPDGTFRFSKLKVPGKNAVDFQIVAQLGYLCYQYPHARFVIVSKDLGYRSAMAELQTLQPTLDIVLSPCIYDSFSLFQKDQYALWVNTNAISSLPQQRTTKTTKQPNRLMASNQSTRSSCEQENSTPNVIAFHAKDITINQSLPPKVKTLISTLDCNEQTKKALVEDVLASPNKADLHNRLRRHLRGRGVELYNEIKDCLCY